MRYQINRFGKNQGTIFVLGVIGIFLYLPAKAQIVQESKKMQPTEIQARSKHTLDLQATKTFFAILQKKVGTPQENFLVGECAKPEERVPHVSYGLQNQLTAIKCSKDSAIRFYFQAGKLFLVYMGPENPISSASANDVKATFGKPDAALRSRAGKTSNLYVYAKQGLAFSIGETVEFIEIFSKMSLNEYKKQIYQDPGPFTK